MQKRVLGKTGMEVSILGFGGAEIGFEAASRADVEKLLNSALDAGLNVIDTAHCYVDSEEKLGKAVAHRRNECYLFTKCGHDGDWDRPDWKSGSITKSIELSLRRLNTDYLDLIQLHSCSKDVLAEGSVIEALVKARDAGKTRFIGYSGDNEDALFAVGTGAFDTLQTSVNIADQGCLEQTIPEAVEKGMGIIAKRPIANVAWRTGRAPENEYARPYWERLCRLDYDFLKGDLARSVGKALAFTLSVPGVCTAIVGTKNPDRFVANKQLIENGLISAEEFESIRTRWNEVADDSWDGQV